MPNRPAHQKWEKLEIFTYGGTSTLDKQRGMFR